MVSSFLIAVDRQLNKQIFFEKFDDSNKAVLTYDAKEREYWEQKHIDVCLFFADSLEDVKFMNSTYFPDEFPFDPKAALEAASADLKRYQDSFKERVTS